MGAVGRSSIFAVCFALLIALLSQNTHPDSMLEGVPSGKTRVLDLSYAINDKLVPWPGDEKFFEAKVNASVEKDGYFTRSFRMLEHYGTHLDAPAHFPPGKTTVDQIPAKQLSAPRAARMRIINLPPHASKNGRSGTDGFLKARLCCCGRVGRRAGPMRGSIGIRMKRASCIFRDSRRRRRSCS